jgi:hypothetical protein
VLIASSSGVAAGSDESWRSAVDELAGARKLKAAGSALQAYHHAGRAVEFALKAIYMRRRTLKVLPEECRGAKWHSLPHIATCAGLDPELIQLSKDDKNRYRNWMRARDWDSKGRFPGNKPPVRELNDLFLAVCHERAVSWHC